MKRGYHCNALVILQNFGATSLLKLSFQNIWRLVKIIALIQVFNVAMDYFAWLAYGYLVPGWTFAILSIGYTILVLAIKKAQENAAKAPF
jgi:hypothetical protein